MHEQPEPTDEDLMLAYARGRAAAFETLFERHRRRLFTYLLHQTGSQPEAEDLLQEVFLRLIRRRRNYVRTGSFRSWLYAIAHNALTDDRRRRSVRERARAGATETEDDRMKEYLKPGGGELNPVAASQRLELRERIEAALLRLPEAQREVFLLRERAGLGFAHIAEATGCGLATAKSRMRYALENLRRHLSESLVPSTEVGHD